MLNSKDVDKIVNDFSIVDDSLKKNEIEMKTQIENINLRLDEINHILKKNEKSFEKEKEKLNSLHEIVKNIEKKNEVESIEIKALKVVLDICQKSIEAFKLNDNSLVISENKNKINSLNDIVINIQKKNEVESTEIKELKDNLDICQKSIENFKLKENSLGTLISGNANSLLLSLQKFDNLQNSTNEIKKEILRANEFIWKIEKFSLKIQSATNGKMIVIESKPFLSHINGYKMCLWLYPQLKFTQNKGAKEENERYIGLYFRIMVGDYDDILEWPLKHKVNIFIRTQESGEVMFKKQYCLSDADKTYEVCFNRPIDNRNVVCGSQTFIKLNELLNNKLVIKNDAFYIVCSVDFF